MSAGMLRSAGIYGVANLLSAGVPFLLLPVLTRVLTPSEYGNVISFYMLVAVCSAVAGLSMHAAIGIRWADPSKGDPRGYTASALLLVFLSTAFAAILSAIFGPLVGVDLSPSICALAALMAGTNVIQGMRFAVWQLREEPMRAAALQVAAASMNVILSLLAVFVAHLGGLGRILGAVATGVLVAVLCVYSLRQDGSTARVTTADSRGLLRFGLPLIPHAFGGAILTSADRFAVSANLGSAALGIYGTASQLGMVLTVLADAATKAYTPTMYRMLSKNTIRSRLRLVALAYASVPIWLAIAFALWGCYVGIGTLLLGDRYLEAVDLAIWFLLGGAVSGVYLNMAGLFFFTGKTELISLATVVASVVVLMLVASAVARFGLVGGAMTYLSGQLVLLIAAWAVSLRITPIPWSSPILAMRVLFRRRKGAP